jgi:DNA-directed RNA polymerase specialized sigma24 family protein
VKSEVTTEVCPPSDIDPYARWLIKHKVRRLVRSNGIRRADEEDLAQDLALHVHLAAQKYDSRRGAASTFYDRVLARKIASIVQSRTAQKRDFRRERPLDSAPAHTFSRPEPSERVDLQLDVRDAVARLSGDLRPVACLFMEYSEAELIRRTGISRQRVRGLRQRIGQELRAAGLAEYIFQSSQPTSPRTPYIPSTGRRSSAQSPDATPVAKRRGAWVSIRRRHMRSLARSSSPATSSRTQTSTRTEGVLS